MVMGVVGHAGTSRPALLKARSRRETSGRSLTRQSSETSQGGRSVDSTTAAARSRRMSRSGSVTAFFHPLEALQEALPAQEHWIHSGKLRKRVVAQDVSWQERLVVLTKDALFLSRMDARRVGESIPLLEITGVVKLRQMEDPEAGGTSMQDFNGKRRGPADGTSRKNLFPRAGSAHPSFVFEIQTSRDGHFNGRTYAIRCDSEAECSEWIQKIELHRTSEQKREEAAKKVSEAYERWVHVQHACKRVYNWRAVQGVMAVLVILNFIVAIAEAEMVPEPESDEWTYFYFAEIVFTAAFAIELLLNLVGHWFRPFWEDQWNIFDFFIVASSLIVIPLSDLPGFAILRLFRVFRIMRLFRWMKDLRVLIRALAASVFPVMNAFAILAIITCLYAVIGVQLFGTKTPERFDKFSNAFFTMIQVCTGDGWAESVARPMWDDYKGPQVSLFFVTYILIAGTFLLNIVVAVLLDEFITSVEKDKQTPIEEARRAHEEEFFKHESPLDPLVSTLTRYTSNEDLNKQIQDVFELLDPAEKGSISFKELQDGLRRLPFEPPIVLTTDDFQEITHHHKLSNFSGQVDVEAFTAIMRTQLRRFVHKYLNLKCTDSSEDNTWLILSLKQVLLSGEKNQESGAEREERAERMERMVGELRLDMQQLKEALGVGVTRESTPAGSGAQTPKFASSWRSSFRSGSGGGGDRVPSVNGEAGGGVQRSSFSWRARSSSADSGGEGTGVGRHEGEGGKGGRGAESEEEGGRARHGAESLGRHGGSRKKVTIDPSPQSPRTFGAPHPAPHSAAVGPPSPVLPAVLERRLSLEISTGGGAGAAPHAHVHAHAHAPPAAAAAGGGVGQREALGLVPDTSSDSLLGSIPLLASMSAHIALGSAEEEAGAGAGAGEREVPPVLPLPTGFAGGPAHGGGVHDSSETAPATRDEGVGRGEGVVPIRRPGSRMAAGGWGRRGEEERGLADLLGGLEALHGGGDTVATLRSWQGAEGGAGMGVAAGAAPPLPHRPSPPSLPASESVFHTATSEAWQSEMLGAAMARDRDSASALWGATTATASHASKDKGSFQGLGITPVTLSAQLVVDSR